MIVEVSVGDGDKVRSMRKVDQAVIGVFANSLVAREVTVVNPDVR